MRGTDPNFSGLLSLHTAVVFRRQKVSADPEDVHVDPFGQKQKIDPFGQPTRDEQESHRLACRFSTPKGGKRMEERSHDVVEVRGKLFLERGADLREDDVVTVLAPSGESIVERATVQTVDWLFDGLGEHHREATIVTQRQAR